MPLEALSRLACRGARSVIKEVCWCIGYSIYQFSNSHNFRKFLKRKSHLCKPHGVRLSEVVKLFVIDILPTLKSRDSYS